MSVFKGEAEMKRGGIWPAVGVILFACIAVTSTAGAEQPTYPAETDAVQEPEAYPLEMDNLGEGYSGYRIAGVIGLVDTGWSGSSSTYDCAPDYTGWGNDQWQLTLTMAKDVTVGVTDGFCPGDFYEVYVDGCLIGTTPDLAPPWGCDFSGPMSSGSFTVSLPPGVYLITVRDAGFDGHTAAEIEAQGMCPAGYSVSISLSAHTGIPFPCNEPPVCDADGPYDKECQGSVTTVGLDGSGSSDPDGDPLTYSWTTNCPGGSFDDPSSPTAILALTSGGSCLINCTVTLAVTDRYGAISTCGSAVTVEDTTGPTVTCPGNLTVECDGAGNPAELSAWQSGFTASDVCNGLIDLSHCFLSILCGDTFETGCHADVYDLCWNHGPQCAATFTVEDTTPPQITCPPDVTVTCGDPTDPDATGWATATDICDDDPAVFIWRELESWSTCLADPVMYKIARFWRATDECDNSRDCVQMITVMKLPLDLDIKPGSCPNSFNRGGHGVLPVGLLGTADFDVSTVDLSTVRLLRTDCWPIGASVAPHEGPPGPHSVFEDVGTPFDGEACDCHELEGDGIVDLSMKFKTEDVVETLALDDFDPGALVEFAVVGQLDDGCWFIATDCVRLVPPGTPGALLAVESSVPGAWIGVDPLDETLDGGGFADFVRTFPETTVVTLTAEEWAQGRPLRGWQIGGLLHHMGETSVEFAIDQDTTVRAVYGPTPSGSPKPPGEMTPDEMAAEPFIEGQSAESGTIDRR